MIVRGRFHDREGKVTQVYRKKFVIHVERISKDRPNGSFTSSTPNSFKVQYYS